MEYQNALIVDCSFSPHERVDSELVIYVYVMEERKIKEINDSGSIESLSKKYEFHVKPGPIWDFEDLYGRKCLVKNNNGVYQFEKFLTSF